MFLMSLKTLRTWLMMHEFEMLINLFNLIIFTILLAIKVDANPSNFKWIYVFIPLFLIDFLQTYFHFIVFIRMYKEYELKRALVRFVFTLIMLILKFLFKILLFYTINGDINIKFAYISLPIFLFLIILLFKSCTLKNHDVID